MALSSTTRRWEYSGNGATTAFAYSTRLVNQSYMVVTLVSSAGVATVKTLTTHYTVSGVGEGDGGNVTMVTAPASGETLVLHIIEPLTQATDIRNQGSYLPQLHEDAFDHLIRIDQQQQNALDKSPHLPAWTDTADFDMEYPADMIGAASLIPITNATGDGWADVADWPDGSGISGAAASATAAAASATAAASSATAAASSATAAASSATSAASSATAAAAAAASANALAPYGLNNIGLSTSVAANALTIALKQADGSTDPSSGTSSCGIYFRSSTLTSGAAIARSVTGALSLTVNSTATLGHNDALADYIYVYALDNAGTVELAVSSSNLWDEGTRYSTTAMTTSSDDAATLYSASARSNVAIRLIGRLLSSQTTAGTWASAMTEVTVGNTFQKKDVFLERAASFIPKHACSYNVSTAGARTISLPVPRAGFFFDIKDSTSQAGTNNITLARNASETIEGASANYTFNTNGGYWRIWSNGTNWWILNLTPAVPTSAVIVDTGNGYGSTNTKIRRFTNTRVSTGTDITYADSAANGGSFTINRTAIYSITYCEGNDAVDAVIGISVNGSALTTSIESVTYATGKRAISKAASSGQMSVSITLRLAAGDIVRAHTDGGPGASNDDCIFSVCQVAVL